jgi:hypothetical protein
MGKLLASILFISITYCVSAQQAFPLQMEGEYRCEVRYGCAAPFKVVVEKDSLDSTKFSLLDSCPNAFGGLFNFQMHNITFSPDSFRGFTNSFNCYLQGKFHPSVDSLSIVRWTLGCGSGCTCGLVYKCKKVIPVGLAENKLEKLQLLPNPVRESLQIKYFNGVLNYSIYNSLGALSKSGVFTETNAQLEVRTLPKGIYFIQFEQDGLQYTQKFVKE